jgi:hypothetical protein
MKELEVGRFLRYRKIDSGTPTSVGQITQELRLENVEMLPSIFWMTA